MTVKRLICVFTLCCVLLLPLTATAAEIGDVDGDNTITTTDVRLVLAHATHRPYDFSLDPDAADVQEPLPGEMGDVDLDGKITSTDARLILQYVVNKITEDDLTVLLADMDGDTFLTTTDARLTLQQAVGKVPALPQPRTLTTTKTDTPPEGEKVSFTVIESVKENGYSGPSSSHSFYTAENAAQWAYLRNTHGFTAAYDETFFEDKMLLVGNLWMPNLETLFEIKQVAKTGSTLEVLLRSYYETDRVSPMIAHTLVAVEIPQSVLAEVDSVAVYTQYDPLLPIA